MTITEAPNTDLRHLAAHTVVIKGVKIYQNGVSVEYSDLEIMQMIGRAVRNPLYRLLCVY
jgi:replicative superfamily II helicase